MKFKVQTTDGNTVNKGSDKHETGLDEDVAQADATRRNQQAEELGITTRYEVAPLQ